MFLHFIVLPLKLIYIRLSINKYALYMYNKQIRFEREFSKGISNGKKVFQQIGFTFLLLNPPLLLTRPMHPFFIHNSWLRSICGALGLCVGMKNDL